MKLYQPVQELMPHGSAWGTQSRYRCTGADAAATATLPTFFPQISPSLNLKDNNEKKLKLAAR